MEQILFKRSLLLSFTLSTTLLSLCHITYFLSLSPIHYPPTTIHDSLSLNNYPQFILSYPLSPVLYLLFTIPNLYLLFTIPYPLSPISNSPFYTSFPLTSSSFGKLPFLPFRMKKTLRECVDDVEMIKQSVLCGGAS